MKNILEKGEHSIKVMDFKRAQREERGVPDGTGRKYLCCIRTAPDLVVGDVVGGKCNGVLLLVRDIRAVPPHARQLGESMGQGAGVAVAKVSAWCPLL